MSNEAEIQGGHVVKVKPGSNGEKNRFRSYALLEKTDSGWKVVELSRSYPTRSKPSQEILGINAGEFAPVYNVKKAYSSYLCDIYCLMGDDQKPYQPCESQFYGANPTLDNIVFPIFSTAITLGTCPAAYNYLDGSAVADAVNESKVLEQEQAFYAKSAELEDKVEWYRKRIVVRPKVVNRTGVDETYFPKVRFKVEAAPLGSQLSIEDVSYQITAESSYSKHNITVPKAVTFKYDLNGILYEPVVGYNEFYVSSLSFPSLGNRDVNIVVYSISEDYGNTIAVKARIDNKSGKFLQAGSIAVYFDDAITSYDFDNMAIPPDATKEISFKVQSNYNSPINSILGNSMGATKSKENHRIGVGFLYHGGSNDQLNESATYPLAKLVR
ncbi:hypothetical protein [Desulfocurvibacter africanus]|uniref:hypothetical protein n=1 Tax=Desulfocurvibacter africanus TaxID=873 RepID=UPI00110C43DD|nr:hypothetical protein [Desulfocurvibacter africanus]